MQERPIISPHHAKPRATQHRCTARNRIKYWLDVIICAFDGPQDFIRRSGFGLLIRQFLLKVAEASL